nr:hypothetical protein [Tanacetum cinerariifolium]
MSILWMQIDLLAMQEANSYQTVFGKDLSKPLMADNFAKNYMVFNSPCCSNEELVSPKENDSCTIKYALTVNPNIYVSCIKQFRTIVVVKKVNDVIRLEALVDKKKVVVTEATIRDALHLDDAEGVECLPNEEIFAELARMGYEKPSTKLTFFKAFFSSQWKKQVGDISTHTTKYTSPALTQKVFANMRRVGDAEVYGEKVNAGDAAEGYVSATNDEVPTVVVVVEVEVEVMVVEPEVVEAGDAEVYGEEVNAGDAAEGYEDESEPTEVQEVVDVVTTGNIITEVVTTASETITAARDAEVYGEKVNAGDAAEGYVSATNDEVPTVAEKTSIPSPTPPTSPPQPSQDIPSTS